MVQQPPGPPPGGMQPPPPPQAPMVQPGPQVSASKLPLADIIVAAGSLIFIILSGIGWYKSKLNITEDLFLTGEEPSLSLGGGVMSTLAMVFAILLLIFSLVMIANNYLNFIPMQLPTGLIYLGFTALILLLMVIGIFVKPDVSIAGYEIGTIFGELTGEEVPGADLSWVMWIISLIFALGIGVGGFLKVNES